jgi:esterase/lipase superfamily enzyme
MFVVTNRRVNEGRTDLAAFGSKPNPEGANELRMAEAKKVRGKWKIKILPDEITSTMAAEVGLSVPAVDKVYSSQYVIRRLMTRVNPKLTGGTGKGRNLVLFVHGFNNDMEAALDRAAAFQRIYGVEVLVFSWPANGGGVKGAVSYLSDKRDARASVGALDRVLAKINAALLIIHREHETRVTKIADQKFGDDAEAWDQFYAEEATKWCPFTLNLVLHSMGNYLFKCLMTSSVYRAQTLTFDNVVLVAADTNNENHAEWVEKIPVRKRVLITINEDDIALRASRVKMGELQKARLGHHLFGLNASNAVYVNFTNAKDVGSSHAYFEGDAIQNPTVKAFFKAALNGREAEVELNLPFNSARNTYEVK